MTKKEITGYRDLTFSGWVRENLPDSSTGYMASDLDFIFWNYKTKKVMFIEIKTRGCNIKTWQKNMWYNLNKWIIKGIDKDWQYLGFYLIQFEKTNFNDGKCFLNGKEINEQELMNFLSL
jgi:hypothetical protein